MIIFIGVNISNVTPKKAKIFNSIQITLYVIPVFISLVSSYLISHRIYFTTRQLPGRRMRKNNKLKSIMEITIQSSLIYTLVLSATVAMNTPVPTSMRTELYYSIYSYLSAILGPVTVRLRRGLTHGLN